MGFVAPSYTSVGSYYTYRVAPSSQSKRSFSDIFWSSADIRNVSPDGTLLLLLYILRALKSFSLAKMF